MYFQLVTLILLIVHANGMLRSSTSRHSAYEIEESQPSISSCFYEIPDLPPRSQPGFLPAFPKERDEFAGKNVDALPYNTEIVFKPMAGIYPVQGLMPFAQGNEQVMLQPAPTDRTGTVLAVWIPKHLVRPERSFKVTFWTHKYLDDKIDLRATYLLDNPIGSSSGSSFPNEDYSSTRIHHESPVNEVHAAVQHAYTVLQELWNEVLEIAPWGGILPSKSSLEFRQNDPLSEDILRPGVMAALEHEFPEVKSGKPLTRDHAKRIAYAKLLLTKKLHQGLSEEEYEKRNKMLNANFALLELVRLQIRALEALQRTQTQRNHDDFYLYVLAHQDIAKYVPGRQRISLAYPDPNVEETIFGMAWYYEFHPVYSGYNVDLETEKWGAYRTTPPDMSSVKKNN